MPFGGFFLLFFNLVKKSREVFTDSTRAMAVGGGATDNKKALAQRKKQVAHKTTIRQKTKNKKITGETYITRYGR